jgi:hypothetical protein
MVVHLNAHDGMHSMDMARQTRLSLHHSTQLQVVVWNGMFSDEQYTMCTSYIRWQLKERLHYLVGLKSVPRNLRAKFKPRIIHYFRCYMHIVIAKCEVATVFFLLPSSCTHESPCHMQISINLFK